MVDVRTEPHVGRTGVLIPVGTFFFYLQTHPERLWAEPRLCLNGSGGCCPGIKRPAGDVDHSSPSSTEVEIE